MKIVLTACTNDEHGQQHPGAIIDLHEAEALNYIAQGWALKFEEEVKAEKVERAVAPKHETASAKAQRGSHHAAPQEPKSE